jgi:hypothetical protein
MFTTRRERPRIVQEEAAAVQHRLDYSGIAIN